GESTPPALIRVVGSVPVPPRSVPALTLRPLEAAIEPLTMSALIECRGACITVGARQDQRAAANLDERATRATRQTAVDDAAAYLSREVVETDCELLGAKEEGAGALDRAGGHPGRCQTRHVDYTADIGDEASKTGGALAPEVCGTAGVVDERGADDG